MPIKTVDEIKSDLKNDDLAYLGPNILAEEFNISTSKSIVKRILNYLNFKRAYKTEYEVPDKRG